MDRLTTRERAAAILSAHKLRMLEAEHMTVVSALEWYQMQGYLAEMRRAIELSATLVDGIVYMVADGDFMNCDVCEAGNKSLEIMTEPLKSDAGKAFAERVQALEKFYNATTKRDALLSQKNPYYETLDFVKDQAWWQEMAELISQAEGAIAEAVDELEAIDRG